MLFFFVLIESFSYKKRKTTKYEKMITCWRNFYKSDKIYNSKSEFLEKKKEQVMRKNRGITLIALVITIIVLLILAGVSIASLMGENGILRKSDEGKRRN